MPLGVYVAFGLEAPGAAALGGLVLNPATLEWDAFLWGGQSAGPGGWKQCGLDIPADPASQVLVVFGLGTKPNEYQLRVYRPGDWTLVAWLRDTLNTPQVDLDKTNYGVQLRCVTCLATGSGSLPTGATLRGAQWKALSSVGLDYSTGSPGWSYFGEENTYGPSYYPPDSAQTDLLFPDVQVSLGG